MSASQHPQLPQCSCRHSINVGTPQVSNDGAISSTTVSKRCRQQHGGKRLGPYLPSCLSRRSLGTTTTASEPSLGRNVSWKPTSCPVTCHSQPSTAPASRDTCRGSQQWATDVTNHAAPLAGRVHSARVMCTSVLSVLPAVTTSLVPDSFGRPAGRGKHPPCASQRQLPPHCT